MESRALSEVEKKLQHLCEAVGARTEEMLPASSTIPAAAAIVSSEALTVMTLPARALQHVESEDRQRTGEIHLLLQSITANGQ